ncbi:ribulose-phosphate 3-epimerase [Mycoplasmopsis alligatoris]|uniref:Ribulose-phosphate 3-epimerase n=1 Tax=Mycoplasmopsis alligatoris A21JP2 TaxID=747682 RepID=D4XX28_9BACT|nr:ribulose-phosphate 3-epimerase [Mycoplasmopsis alligatoris]EFF41089.1 ribulose-phosphate 3-epimerase [Mycoplasmopsis alligatoris A21JP2]
MEKNITPSLLNVEENKRLEMANTLINAGIKWIHYDIMDGKFVPNTAIKTSEIANIHKNGLRHFKDAHLMVENPLNYLEELKDIVDVMTVHWEAFDDKDEFYDWLDQNYVDYKIGLAIKPNTSVEEIIDFLPYVALVLVMSVEPGKGGQAFIPTSLDKIKFLSEYRHKNNLGYAIQVDGGINQDTSKLCFKNGADALVAGTYLVVEPTKERIKTLLG